MKKIAIVTGARRGIGLAIARKMMSDGYTTVLCATTDASRTEELMAELNRMGEAYYYRCDISVPEEREQLLDTVLERFGRIDVLVNNAGVACEVRLNILETTPESFERLMRINCEGTFFMCQGAANRMIACPEKGTSGIHAPDRQHLLDVSLHILHLPGRVLHLQGGHLHGDQALCR